MCKNANIRKYIDEHDALKKDVEKFQAQAVERAKDKLVENAKEAGERPTAAFPSSHVGVSTICMLLAWHSRNRKLLFTMLPFYIFLCMATVYIQAHYLIDAIAGWISAVVIYFMLMAVSKNMK